MSFTVRDEAAPDDTVVVVRGGQVRQADFQLLASGEWPHYDIVLADLGDKTVERLRACFGPPFANPGASARLEGP